MDYLPDVPDGGVFAVQIPTIQVRDDSLFYLVNWNAPIGSAEGPGGLLMRASIVGGKPTRLASIGSVASQGGQGLAVTGTAAIFSEVEGKDGAAAIVRVSTTDGERTTLALTSGLANAIVADEANVYFVDDEGTKSVPVAGGPARILTTAKPFSLGLARETLYLADYGPSGTISSMPVSGGALTILANDPRGVLYPQACSESLCWVTGPALDASLTRLNRDGTLTRLAEGFAEPHDFVFDGSHFFVSTGHLFLHRIPAEGGEPALIASQGLITSLDIDGSCLYWSSAQGIFSWALSAADTEPSIAQ